MQTLTFAGEAFFAMSVGSRYNTEYKQFILQPSGILDSKF